MYEPTWESLSEHKVPKWYDDAKFGIFIHWGIYSVPGWAPTTGELGEVPEEVWFVQNPYAEWYLNSMRIKESPTWKHHVETYGENFDYYSFLDMWNIDKWDPEEWAELFKKAGAKYVIPTAKHHEGFCLWPSEYTDFCVTKKGPNRDIIGELEKAVRRVGLRFGVYYSGALDWRFTKEPIKRGKDLKIIRPHTYYYADYAYNQFMELIDKYNPDILWNDIGWPDKGKEDLKYLFSYFYNRNPEGLVNDRWEVLHWDFMTAEYKQNYPGEISPNKWEFCRGLGFSFGYNQNEGPEHVLSIEKLVYTLVDVVSRNGNFLLNVGPKADGAIPEIQKERLLQLGKWLEKNGEAIYGTRPWIKAVGKTTDGMEIRFTKKDENLFVIFLGVPKSGKVTIKSLKVKEGTRIYFLGSNTPLDYKQEGENLAVILPEHEESITLILKINPLPES